MLCPNCTFQELVEASMPPDAELVDLIERAYLDGQIDGLEADLAYLFVWKNAQICANLAALAHC